MKIIIIGAGFTGTQLARRLISEQNDVVLIETDDDTVRHTSNRLDCMVIHASGNSLTTLEEAGIAKADALVAVTESDEVNMITCSLVASVYPHLIKIARVRNYDYYLNSSRIKGAPYGINFMVHPDVVAANAIMSAVEHGAISDVMDFENSDFELASIFISETSKLAGKAVQDIVSITDIPFLVSFTENNGKSFLPNGSTILHANDRIGIIAKKKDMSGVLQLCGSQIRHLNKIALVGAGRIGTGIAHKIVDTKKTNKFLKFMGLAPQTTRHLTIIESDYDRAKEAAEKFPKADVYQADVTDEGFIEEEDLCSVDLVISATHNHELNMVTSAYFKTLGVNKTICLVQSENYARIARNIGVDVAIPIKDAVIDSILRHLRGRNITNMHTVVDGEIEIIEAFLQEDSPVIGKKIKDIARTTPFVILLIQEYGTKDHVLPNGNTVLEAGDKLVIILYIKDLKKTLETLGAGL